MGKKKERAPSIKAPPSTCRVCATEHPMDFPHNKESMFYQRAFFQKHGRHPTWADAVAHCQEPLKSQWLAALQGVCGGVGYGLD